MYIFLLFRPLKTGTETTYRKKGQNPFLMLTPGFSIIWRSFTCSRQGLQKSRVVEFSVLVNTRMGSSLTNLATFWTS